MLTLRDWPCRNYHLHGNCQYGEDCKFSHEELTDDTRPLLDQVIQLTFYIGQSLILIYSYMYLWIILLLSQPYATLFNAVAVWSLHLLIIIIISLTSIFHFHACTSWTVPINNLPTPEGCKTWLAYPTCLSLDGHPSSYSLGSVLLNFASLHQRLHRCHHYRRFDAHWKLSYFSDATAVRGTNEHQIRDITRRPCSLRTNRRRRRCDIHVWIALDLYILHLRTPN